MTDGPVCLLMAAPLRSPSRFKMQKVKPVWSLCHILQARDIPTAVSEDACGDLITNIRLERSVFDKVLINSRATRIPCNTKKKEIQGSGLHVVVDSS